MRKLFVLLLFAPLAGMSQVKNVLTSERCFPKMDKIAEFEKALANHAQKYHTGDWRWRVWEIQSGPDAGGYQITEGPNNWDQIDKRGDLGAEHMDDWRKNVAALLTDKYSSQYAEFQEELSTVQLTDYADKIAVLHIFPKPGRGEQVVNDIKKARKAWVADKETVAVYAASSSGPTQYILVFRYKQGLKERDRGFRAPFKDTYETANGKGSWDGFMDDVNKNTDHTWSEIVFFRADLSSK